MTEQGRQDDSTQGSLDDRIAILEAAIKEGEKEREPYGFTEPEWSEWCQLKRKHPAVADTAVHECAHALAFSVFGYPVTAAVLRLDGSGVVWSDRPEPTTETLRQNMVACSVGNCATEAICGQPGRSTGDIAMVRADARRIVGHAAPDEDFDGEILRAQRRARQFVEKYRVDITQLALTLLRFHDRLQRAPLIATVAELDDDPTKPKAVQATDANESKDDAGADAGETESPAKGDAA